MLFELPAHPILYEALVQRDPAYDGQAWVCVSTTGIFCRLTCPAPKPKPGNCTFQPSIRACIEAGFRACKRCQPLRPPDRADPGVARLLAALDADPTRRWSEPDIVALGLDPSTVRRAFKRHYGMTFLEMARQRRLREGFEALSSGGRVIEAQLNVGFDSASAFRAAFARIIGVAPGTLRSDAMLRADWIATPLGDMVAVASAQHLYLLEFIDGKALPSEIGRLQTATKATLGIGSHPPTDQIRAELSAFFAGRGAVFATSLALNGSDFARQVWAALRDIPAGQTRSYADIARTIGRPSATRAVARANGANPIALAVPCHRVIGADGSLTGYGGGLWRKQRLLEIERAYRS